MNVSLFVTLAGLLLAATLRAQTVTYNFSTVVPGSFSEGGGGGIWLEDEYGNGTVQLSGGQARLVSSPAGEGGVLLYWTGAAPYNSNWNVQLDVHMATSATLGVTSPNFAQIGLAVFRTGDTFGFDGNGAALFYGVQAGILRNGALTPSDYFVGRRDTPTGGSVFGSRVNSTSTDAALRISFNSSTKLISTAYDANGATGGYSFTTLNFSSDIDAGTPGNNPSWNMVTGDTFTFVVLLQTTGPVIGAGDVYVSNFTTSGITAVPEPASYAAIVGGLVLAVAAVGRRRRRLKPRREGG